MEGGELEERRDVSLAAAASLLPPSLLPSLCPSLDLTPSIPCGGGDRGMNDGGGGGQIKCGKIGRTKMTQSHSPKEGRPEGKREGPSLVLFLALSPLSTRK